MSPNQIRTRMAPSPTGNLHIGTAYATMWPYVFAHHHRGEFLLRIEDTDQQRSTKQFEENILNGLKWLGFGWDDKIYHQMDRLDIYSKYTQKLLDEGKAYFCFCTKEELEAERKLQVDQKKPQVYSGKCRHLSAQQVKQKLDQGLEHVIRFKMPEDRGIIEFEDLTHGKITWDSQLIGDMVIMRSNGIPLYNFAVVIDDIEMKISHVIRGDDHISNTPKQIVFYEAIGQTPPQFAHYPMVLNQDRVGKLSKRTGSTSVDDFRREGYLPEAMFNYIAYVGWGEVDGKEIFTKDELVAAFDLKKMKTTAAAWNEEKLDWMNGEYIRNLSDQDLTQRLIEFLVDHPNKDRIHLLVPLVKERIKKLSDFVPLTDFIFEKPEYDIEEFSKIKVTDPKNILEKIVARLEGLKKPWVSEEFEQTFRELAQEQNIKVGDMFQLIRLAVSGQQITPPLFESLKIIGEDEVFDRIKVVANNYPNF